MTKLKKVGISLVAGVSTFLTTASLAIAQGNPGNIEIKLPKNGGFFPDFGSLSSLVLRIVLVIAAILVFGYLIMGGLEWITSGGEKSKTESARNKITAAVVGLIILVSSWALMSLVVHFLGYNDLNQLIQQNL